MSSHGGVTHLFPFGYFVFVVVSRAPELRLPRLGAFGARVAFERKYQRQSTHTSHTETQTDSVLLLSACPPPQFALWVIAEIAMSKSDSPPSYRDSTPLVMHDSCCEPPPYDYESQPPPPLYAPTPGYHPAVSQPAPVGHRCDVLPGPGRPAVSMPMDVPLAVAPHVSSVVINPDDEEGLCTRRSWESLEVRHTFLRKVYLILATQLLITLGIVAVFVFVGVLLTTYVALLCCEGPRRRYPWNFILLTIFTLALSYMTGTLSSYYDTKAVFLALGITVVVCVVVTLFSFQTKVDLTSCGGLLCALAIVLFVTSIAAVIVLSLKYIFWVHMLYASIGAVIYTVFLAYDTQLLIGKGKYAISPEEYVFGALMLYIDIIMLFLRLLQLVGASSK
uniref:Transmembrane BAX inhibitor motif containing 1 n=1 Tax=Scleropages formosus TaxID=113540 RepID=A0A8C9T9R8_SCLFO